jgi:transcriptional regulator with GAF, ATPase, and Fis domain
MNITNGTIINQRYAVLETLGKGGQGTVYRAADTLEDDAFKALKILSSNSLDSMFRFEFEQAKQLVHPNLARVFDLGRVTSLVGATEGSEEPSAQGALFYTEELVVGMASHVWISTDEAAKDVVANTARIGSAAAQCLDFIHHAGLLHRDIKPSNILVGDQGRVIKLIDFGSATMRNAWDGQRAFTIGYAAEEALIGYPDERSDIYSLGVTLAELVSGRRPRAFSPPFPEGFLQSRFAQSNGLVLIKVIERMIAKKPEHRFQTAGDVAEALSQLSEQGGNESRYLDEVRSESVRRTAAVRSRAPRLSGRSFELNALLQHFEEALSCDVKTSLLRGPTGVGKSRLFHTAVAEFQLRIAGRGKVPPEFRHGSLRDLLKMIHRDNNAGPLLAAWVGGASATDAVTKNANEDSLIKEMADAFLSIKRPTVVLIESGERRLIVSLLRRLGGEPHETGSMLAIAAESEEPLFDKRPESDNELSDSEVLFLPIHPLDLTDETDLISQMMGSSPKEELAEKIHERTGGIPLVTEALFQSVSMSQLNRDLALLDIDSLLIDSDPLDAAIRGFLSAINEDAREAAETAAVIGSPVSANDLGWAIWGEEAKADDLRIASCLATLEKNGWAGMRNGLVYLRPAIADRVTASLPSLRIKTLHQRALSLLDRNQSGLPWQIADHAYLCNAMDRAKTAALSAYEVLVSTGDLGGAAFYLGRALELRAFSKNDEGPMTVRLAKLYRETGDYQEALKTLAEASSLSGTIAERAALERASSLRLIGRVDEASAVLTPLEASQNTEVKALALSQAARIDFDRGDIAGASARILQVFADDLPIDGRLEIQATMGLIALAASDLQKAEAVCLNGLNEAIASCDSKNRARFLGLIGMLRHRGENFSEAAVNYAEAAVFADKCGDRHGAAAYLVNLAAVKTELGQFQEALDAYRECLTRLRRFGRLKDTALAGANYAELLYRLGDVIGAEIASRSAVEDMRSSMSAPISSVLSIRGEVLLELKRIDEAEEILKEAESVARAVQSEKELVIACLHSAACALERMDFGEATRRLTEAKAAQCDASSAFAIEYLRLFLLVEEATGGNTESALLELMSRLPLDDTQFQDDHLKALATAAVVAVRLGRRDIAERAARAAKALSLAVHQKTPSLYQKSEPPYSKEINMVLRSESETSFSAGPPGWEHLFRINTRLNSEFRIGRLLEMIMDAALDITRAERGFLLIADMNGELQVRSARNMDKESLSLDESNFSRSAAQKAFESKEPLLTADAGEDTRFIEMKSVVNLKLRYIVAVPLLVGGKAKGAIYLDSKQAGRFDESRLALLEALADQAAIALTNARLKVEIEQRQQRIERLNRELTSLLKQREVELLEVKGELEKRTAALIVNYRYEEFIAQSKPMTEVFHLLDRVTALDFPVIIQGESGTGKELAARAIHFNSARKKKSFVAENCAAIPETLMESVLFGHAKGAFTGATSDSRGLFAEADGGTLFLDEVSELSLSMQAKLLRVLQNNEVRPVGAAKTRIVNVRVLAATNTDLKRRVQEGTFREDLFYRLNVIEITLPPLRERKEDILILAGHFVAKHSDKKKRITKAAAEILLNYSWPGNVRRLENEMIRAAVLSDDEIEPEHLSPELLSDAGGVSKDDTDFDVNKQVDRLKRRLLTAALAECKGNQTAASELLGVSRFGLQKMMKRLGI